MSRNVWNFDWKEIRSILANQADAVIEFEHKFAELVGCRYAVAFPYGRSAIYALLKSLEISGKEIIMPAYTCIVVPNAVIYSGNKPVFVDINLADYNCEHSEIKKNISRNTGAIIATHMYGYPTDVAKIKATADNILLIEDAALALLARNTAKVGDAAIYSFSMTKHMVTLDGGMVVTGNSDIYERLVDFRRKEIIRARRIKSFQAFSRLLFYYLVGYLPIYKKLQPVYYSRYLRSIQKSRVNWSTNSIDMPDDYLTLYNRVQAKIGLAQLSKVKESIHKRQELARIYDEELKGVDGIIPAQSDNGATYSYYNIRVKDRARFIRNIKPGIINPLIQDFDYVIPILPVYQSFAGDRQFPNALEAARHIVNLPIYPVMSEKDVRYVSQCVRNAILKQGEQEQNL